MDMTNPQSLIFMARMQAKTILKEEKEALNEWDNKTDETMANVVYYENLIEIDDTPQVVKALENAYHKHERACETYNNIFASIRNIEKAIDALESAEWLMECVEW